MFQNGFQKTEAQISVRKLRRRREIQERRHRNVTEMASETASQNGVPEEVTEQGHRTEV